MTTFERIKKLAKQHGYTLTALNDKAGLGTNTIYHWKDKTPGTDNLSKVARVLGVSTDYLLGNDDHATTKDVDLKKDPVVLSYGGKPVSKEDMDIIKAILERHSNDKK